jgi:hypothetical protein
VSRQRVTRKDSGAPPFGLLGIQKIATIQFSSGFTHGIPAINNDNGEGMMVWSTKINPVSANLDLDQNIDGMLSSFVWDATAFFVAPWSPGIVYRESTITYSFPDSMLDYGSNYSNEPRSNFAP